MLGKLLSYAATRAAGEAVDGLARRAIWTGLAAVLMVFAFGIALTVAYWSLAPEFGSTQTAVAMALACLAAGFAALAVPTIIERAKKAETAAATNNPVTQTVAAVKEETEAAADYFGAVQVVASAFMFGLGTARQLRRKA